MSISSASSCYYCYCPFISFIFICTLPPPLYTFLLQVELYAKEKPSVVNDQLKISLRGGRRFEIKGGFHVSTNGWAEARVNFTDLKEEEREENGSNPLEFAEAMSIAEAFDDLVPVWLELAKKKERSQGQIDALLQVRSCPLFMSDHALSSCPIMFSLHVFIFSLKSIYQAFESFPHHAVSWDSDSMICFPDMT